MASVAAATASTGTAAATTADVTGSGGKGAPTLHPRHRLSRKWGAPPGATVAARVAGAPMAVGTAEPTGSTNTTPARGVVAGQGRRREEDHSSHGRPTARSATRPARLSA